MIVLKNVYPTVLVVNSLITRRDYALVHALAHRSRLTQMILRTNAYRFAQLSLITMLQIIPGRASLSVLNLQPCMLITQLDYVC